MTARAAANRRGIVYMASGMSCLVLNDTLMKHVGQSLGVAQLICVRGVLAVLMIMAVAHALGATTRLRTSRPPISPRACGRRNGRTCR